MLSVLIRYDEEGDAVEEVAVEAPGPFSILPALMGDGAMSPLEMPKDVLTRVAPCAQPRLGCIDPNPGEVGRTGRLGEGGTPCARKYWPVRRHAPLLLAVPT